MTILTREHVLAWMVELTSERYTVHTLYDQKHRRWAWIVNAAAHGWTAHVGGWGSSPADPVPLTDVLQSFDGIAEAKAWVEETIATQWAAPRTSTVPTTLGLVNTCRHCHCPITQTADKTGWLHAVTFDGRTLEVACEPDMQSMEASP